MGNIYKMNNFFTVSFILLIGISFFLFENKADSAPWILYNGSNYTLLGNWEKFGRQNDGRYLLSMSARDIFFLLKNPDGRSSDIFNNKLDHLFSILPKVQTIYDGIIPDICKSVFKLFNYMLPGIYISSDEYNEKLRSLSLETYAWLLDHLLASTVYVHAAHSDLISTYNYILHHVSTRLEPEYFERLHSEDQAFLFRFPSFFVTNVFLDEKNDQCLINLNVSSNWASMIIPAMILQKPSSSDNIEKFKKLYNHFNCSLNTIFENSRLTCDRCKSEFLLLVKKCDLEITYKTSTIDNSFTRFLNGHVRLESRENSVFSMMVGEIRICDLPYCNLAVSRSPSDDTLQFTILPPNGFFPQVTIDTHGLCDDEEKRKSIEAGSALHAILEDIPTKLLLFYEGPLEEMEKQYPVYSNYLQEPLFTKIYISSFDSKSAATCISLNGLLEKFHHMNRRHGFWQYESFPHDFIILMSGSTTHNRLHLLTVETLKRIISPLPWDVAVIPRPRLPQNPDSSMQITIHCGIVNLYEGDGFDLQYPSPQETSVIVGIFLRHPYMYQEFRSVLKQEIDKIGVPHSQQLNIPDLLQDLQRCMSWQPCRTDLVTAIPDIFIHMNGSSRSCAPGEDEVTVTWYTKVIFKKCVCDPTEIFGPTWIKSPFDANRYPKFMKTLLDRGPLKRRMKEVIFNSTTQENIDFMMRHRKTLGDNTLERNILQVGSVAQSLNLSNYNSSTGEIILHMDHLVLNCSLHSLISAVNVSGQYEKPEEFALWEFKAIPVIFFNAHIEDALIYTRAKYEFLQKIIEVHPVEDDWIYLFKILAAKSIVIGCDVPFDQNPPSKALIRFHFRSVIILKNDTLLCDLISKAIVPLRYNVYVRQSDLMRQEMIYTSILEDDLEIWEKMTANDLVSLFITDACHDTTINAFSIMIVDQTRPLNLNVSTLVDNPDLKISLKNVESILLSRTENSNITIPNHRKEFILNFTSYLAPEYN